MKCVDLCKQPMIVCGCDICSGESLCEGMKHIWPQRNNFINHACCIFIIILTSHYNEYSKISSYLLLLILIKTAV